MIAPIQIRRPMPGPSGPPMGNGGQPIAPAGQPQMGQPAMGAGFGGMRDPRINPMQPMLGSFKKGGKVKKTGKYLLHKGEKVVKVSSLARAR
jgi:hypothetical protein